MLTRQAEPALLAAVAAAGVDVEVLSPDETADVTAERLRTAASESGLVTWLAGPGDEVLVELLGDRDGDRDVEVEVMHGNWDPPGARLLDVVAIMDRLRSPGGCPWDAEQNHASLAKYLLEEAYETLEAIENDDLDALREELGDVLLQVAFHARIAQERPDDGWSIDDVAQTLVDKLVRRHPHVFADVDAADADEVTANWESIKAVERGGASPLSTVPLGQPSLTLAATLQRKARRTGLEPATIVPELAAATGPASAVSALAARFEDRPEPSTAGELLWAVVAMLADVDIDAETALRDRGRKFRETASALTTGPDSMRS